MFKPARMTRILVGGHRDRMQDVVDVLHQHKLVHLEDFEDEATEMGTPMEAGDQMSDLLVHTRGLIKALDAEGLPPRVMISGDPAKALKQAQAALGDAIAEVEAARAEVGASEADVSALAPYAGLDVDLGIASSVWSVKTLIGRCREEPRLSVDSEIIYNNGAVAVIVPVDQADMAERQLSSYGFQAATLPEVEGTPTEAMATATAVHREALAALESAEAKLAALNSQWGERLASLEAYLAAEVQKTQAPLQFGMTESTFHVEGWVPANKAAKLESKLMDKVGSAIYFESLGDAPAGDHHHPSAADEAPVKLDNKGAAKPYEFMLGLLGRPRYWELDPTKLMFIFFPLFFGLMVGDVLVGLAIMGLGLYLKKNHIFGIGGPSVGRALFAGGLVAVIVGAFIFGEALGMHFVVSEEALEDGEHSWEEIFYGKDEVLAGGGFPEEGFFHKEISHHGADDHATDHGNATGNATDMHQAVPGQMYALAESTEGTSGNILKPHGEVHLKAGPVQLGFYSKIHDIQALLAWCIIIAVVHLNLAFMLGIRNVAVGHGVTLAIQEKLSWILAQASLAVAVWGGVAGNKIALAVGLGAFVASIGLLWKGVEKALGAPGFVAILEFLGFFGNILSYTRLAAIGASKAGMALAFAAIGFDVIGGGSVHSIAGWIVYIIGMVLIIALATLSGGLQSLRLQFVEFFGKFFEGGGRPYEPFGRR